MFQLSVCANYSPRFDVPGRSVSARIAHKILPSPSLKTRIDASSELLVGAVHLPPGRVYFRAEFVYLSLVFIAPLLDISDLKIFTNANFLDLNAAS